MTQSDMTKVLIDFVTAELLSSRKDIELAAADDLLGSGLVDSLGVTRLIRFIEREYDTTVPASDVTIENFMTVQTIVAYLDTRGIHDGTPLVD